MVKHAMKSFMTNFLYLFRNTICKCMEQIQMFHS